MTDRDQLAALIRANVSNVRGLGIEGEHEGWLWESDSGEPLPDAVADAIIAAGWRPPEPDLCAHTSQSRVGDTSQWICNQCGDVDERGGAYA